MSKRISISSRINTLLRIYVVGYPLRGESIICQIIDSSTSDILFSMVVDCFKYYNQNRTLEILKRNGIDQKKIDMVCWTHPDYDHSYGLDEIISSCCDQNTLYVVPKNFYGDKHSVIQNNKEDYKIVQHIANLLPREKNVQSGYVTIDVAAGELCQINHFSLVDAEGELPIQIVAYAPISQQINNRILKSQKISKNELSIFMGIKVGEYQFLLCGDTENDAIDTMDENYFRDVIFVKIPHHSSLTSIHLLTLLKNEILIACTTTYKIKGLPNQQVIAAYKNKTRHMDSTGAPINGEKYGMITYDFDLFNKKEVKITHSGHAICL